MSPCMSKATCTCRKELSYEPNCKLLIDFRKLNGVPKQRQFLRELIGLSCDGQYYTRCFEVSENHFLCRSGLACVLQLTRRQQQEIIPSATYIKQRYNMICVSEIFSALLVYRNSVLQLPPTRRNYTYTESIQWSHPCFSNAIERVGCIHAYRGNNGISTFFSHLQIRKAIKNEQIILGAVGDVHLRNVVHLLNGDVIDMSYAEGFEKVLDGLWAIISSLPATHWKRVAKVSRSLQKGGLIEYTSSTVDSIQNWVEAHSKYGRDAKKKKI